MNTQQTTSEPLPACAGSALHSRVIAPSLDPLMHKVWDGTPWMLDAYTDSVNTDRWYDVMQWCQSEFGQEAWPLHGIEGQWHVGGATIHGWTWIGFATEEMMTRFSERWQNAKAEALSLSEVDPPAAG